MIVAGTFESPTTVNGVGFVVKYSEANGFIFLLQPVNATAAPTSKYMPNFLFIILIFNSK